MRYIYDVLSGEDGLLYEDKETELFSDELAERNKREIDANNE